MTQLSIKHTCLDAVAIFSGKTTSQETSYLEIITTATHEHREASAIPCFDQKTDTDATYVFH